MISAGEHIKKLFAFSELRGKEVKIFLTPSKSELVIFRQWSLNSTICMKTVTLSDFTKFKNRMLGSVSENGYQKLEKALENVI